MRLIDADNLKAELFDANWLTDNDEHMVEEIVERQSTIDTEPARHGRWVYDPDGMDFNLGAWVCSECRERNNNLGYMRRINPYQFVGSRFCPNCGAKMDKCDNATH